MAIEDLVIQNECFRKVLYTGAHCQLVLMKLNPGEEIGVEVHEDGDQFFRFEKGEGRVVINAAQYDVQDGDVAIAPAGATHNVINTSNVTALKFYTLYAPPHHKDGIIRPTKAEAEENAAEFDGEMTE